MFLRAGLQELQKAVALSPDTGFEKYMYLGQLLEGEEAVAATQKGVELLQQVSNCNCS
jgi:kinesin family protein 5